MCACVLWCGVRSCPSLTCLSQQKPVLMRIKLDFTVNGTKLEEMAAVTNFPANV